MIAAEEQTEDVTQVLNAVHAGDAIASRQSFPLIYQELRRLAAARMANEMMGHTLQPTALVHEAWLRLAGNGHWQNRAHFFGAASETMRRVLVDHARKKKSQKRGGGVEPEVLEESEFVLTAPADELLAVHEALDEFAREDPLAAELVKLRYFVGMTMEEAAATLELPVRTAERLWSFARASLKRAIRTN